MGKYKLCLLKTIDLLETLFAYEQSFPLVQFSHAFQSQAELFHFALAWQKETDVEFCKGEIIQKKKDVWKYEQPGNFLSKTVSHSHF